MTLQELTSSVRHEFDSRNLKSNVRYNALKKVVEYIREKHNGNLDVFFPSCPHSLLRWREHTGCRESELPSLCR